MKKKCELCGGVARMYCESDQASLCWDCDEKVHGANFLVAKHTRCLLCSSCQSPTPWKASGPRLGHTISACDSCVSENRSQEMNGHDFDEDRFDDGDGVAESYDDGEEDDDEYDDDDDEEEEDEEDDEEAENQVVPWAAAAAALQPPVVSSSSSVSSGGGGGFPVKRNSDLLYSDDEIGCSSSHHASNSYRPSKRSSTLIHDGGHGGGGGGETATGSTAIINSIMRFHRDKSSDGEDIVFTISNMNRDHSR